MSNGVLKSSMEQGMMHSQNLKEKPKYMLFSVFTVLVYDYSGYSWIAVLVWFFINFLVDASLMYQKGDL